MKGNAEPNPVVELDGRQGRLHEALVVTDSEHRTHVVPAGFRTDFASIPRLFWRLLPPWGQYNDAAIVHDYLYRHGIGTRPEADAIFRSIMAASGVGWLTRNAMWLAVRLFGRSAWKGN